MDSNRSETNRHHLFSSNNPHELRYAQRGSEPLTVVRMRIPAHNDLHTALGHRFNPERFGICWGQMPNFGNIVKNTLVEALPEVEPNKPLEAINHFSRALCTLIDRNVSLDVIQEAIDVQDGLMIQRRWIMVGAVSLGGL